jgi:hypothetical protein
VVAGEPFLPPGGQELFAPKPQEFLQVNGPGPELLFLCEMDVLSHAFSPLLGMKKERRLLGALG